MLQVLVVKLIFGAIHSAIQKKKNIKGLENLKKIDNYVNKDNELDIKVKSLTKEVNILKKDSHPRADWICLECGCRAVRDAKKKKLLRKKRRK